MTAKVRAYVDLVSAFSYIVIQCLDDIVEAHGLEVDWRVVSLPHVLKAAGGSSPLSQPLKARHNSADWERQCARRGLAATAPEIRPVEASLARLVFHRVKRRQPERASTLLRALSARVFGAGQSIASEVDIVSCMKAAGLGELTGEVAAAREDPQAKADLIANFESAMTDGMFGAPFVVIGDASFWGAAQLDAIDRQLSKTTVLPEGFVEVPGMAGFPQGFGPVFRRLEGGQVTLGLRVTPRHTNPAGVAHGGLVATLADMACGAQLAHQLGTRPGVPTVSLTLDFLAPAQLGAWIEVSARVLRAGKRLAFVEGGARTDARQILRFSGTFAPPPASVSADETE